jgi:tetratricopeptide (TPR) repeat protein
MAADLKEQILNFIGNSTSVVVEPSPAFSACLQSFLSDFGIPLSRIKVCRTFGEGKQAMLELKPKLLVSEYDLPPQHGLSLFEVHETLYRADQRVSLIVTKNSSDTVVAEAAEGSVDAFIVKPFSSDFMREKLLSVFDRKLNPSPYQKKISDGQEKATTLELKQALLEFTAAKKLDPRPTLAHYFCGQVLLKMGDVDSALKEYREGRGIEPLHYKCLIGEYEAMLFQKKYADAYNLVPLIRANYPISSIRLVQLCTSIVYAHQFEELPDLYDLYTKLDYRQPLLSDMLSLAMFTGGRYWLRKSAMKEAVAFFNMALNTKNRDIRVLKKIVDEFLALDAVPQAEEMFARVLPSDVGTAAHAQLNFCIQQRLLPADQMLESGRKLVLAGHGTPEIFKSLVIMSVQADKITLAETIIQQATKQDPALQSSLYALLPEKK